MPRVADARMPGMSARCGASFIADRAGVTGAATRSGPAFSVVVTAGGRNPQLDLNQRAPAEEIVVSFSVSCEVGSGNERGRYRSSARVRICCGRHKHSTPLRGQNRTGNTGRKNAARRMLHWPAGCERTAHLLAC